MYDDLTVAFSGHNIKWFVVLAIESFLLHYPSMRDNILYFDDCSTDGTREELENRGIKVITWSEDSYNKMVNMVSNLNVSKDVGYISARVSYIVSEIIMSTKTQYLLILDGDTVTLSDKLLQDYYSLLEKYPVVSLVTNNGELSTELKFKHIDSTKEMYNYYQRLKYEDETTKEVFYPRIHFLTTLLDVFELSKVGIIGDRLEMKYLECMNGYIVDTGTDMYHQLIDKDIPIYTIEDIDKYIYHWTWISSGNRVVDSCCDNMYRQSVMDILQKCKTMELEEILNKINISPVNLTRQLRLTQNKSKLI